MKVYQVDGTEWVCILWSMKYCIKAGANLHSLTWELSHKNKIKSDHKNNILVQSSNGDDMFLVSRIKAHDGWGAIVQWLQEIGHGRVQLARSSTFKPISAIFGKGLQFKNLVTCASPDTKMTPIRQSLPIKVSLAYRLVLQKATQLLPTMCTTPRHEKLFWPKTWLSYTSHMENVARLKNLWWFLQIMKG